MSVNKTEQECCPSNALSESLLEARVKQIVTGKSTRQCRDVSSEHERRGLSPAFTTLLARYCDVVESTPG